jgi:hypothetical protein
VFPEPAELVRRAPEVVQRLGELNPQAAEQIRKPVEEILGIGVARHEESPQVGLAGVQMHEAEAPVPEIGSPVPETCSRVHEIESLVNETELLGPRLEAQVGRKTVLGTRPG